MPAGSPARPFVRGRTVPDRLKFPVGCFLLLTLAAGLRFAGLAGRPMHTDEAVHAVKFGELLEGRGYKYDPAEYHGPTLNYFTLVPAFLRGERTFPSLTETTLRSVPAFFGTALLLWMILLIPVIGRTAVFGAMLFAAVSPSLVFYSRYYIQESILLFFVTGLVTCAVRYSLRPSFSWAAAAGLCAGLTHATKETCVIAWAAAAAVGLVLFLPERNRPRERPRVRWTHFAAGLACGMAVSVLFFSSFFANLPGVAGSFAAYGTYLRRAGESVHVHPWFYYIHILGWWKAQGGPVWSEAPVAVLGIAGSVAAFRGGGEPWKAASRFLVLFTVFLTVLVSLIPYKTPWNLLLFWGGWMILAGMGADFLLKRFSAGRFRAALRAALAATAVLLFWESVLAVTAHDSDPKNPYVYSHPGPDLGRLVNRVRAAAAASPEGTAVRVDVIVPEHGYWPLPWSLRRLNAVAWRDTVDAAASRPDIVLAVPGLRDKLVHWLIETPPPGECALYVPLFDRPLEIRPGVPVEGWVRMDLAGRMNK